MFFEESCRHACQGNRSSSHDVLHHLPDVTYRRLQDGLTWQPLFHRYLENFDLLEFGTTVAVVPQYVFQFMSSRIGFYQPSLSGT